MGFRLGLDGEAEVAIDMELKRVSKELAKIRQTLSGYSFAIISQNLIFNPHRAIVYLEDLMVPIKYICILDTSLFSNLLYRTSFNVIIELGRHLESYH